MIKNNKQQLFLIMKEAINSSKPDNKFPKLLEKPKGNIYVLGAGKAAGSMAKAFEDECPFELEGFVVTRYDHFVKTKKIKVVEASHPIPDLNGYNATKKIIQIAKNTSKDDLVIFLISGGASALLCSPLDGIYFDEKQKINNELLKSGASIDEMNIVRQSISAVKGGRLLELIKPSNCITYGISDIPGDDPSFIGSGPTIYSNNDPNKLFEILDNYQIEISKEILSIIKTNLLPKGINENFHLIASPMKALKAASNLAKKIGFLPIILSDKLEGDASKEGERMANLALKIKKEKRYKNISLEKPILLLSGGETTVKVNGLGKGGRNSEFALSMVNTLKGNKNILGLSIDTDGIDGSEDNAGAFFSYETFLKSKKLNLNIKTYINNNDAFSFFEKTKDLIYTGPTLTNVNDFRAVLVLPN